MTEKAKRKGNPRRRQVVIIAAVGLALLTLLAYFLVATRSTGDYIVYINETQSGITDFYRVDPVEDGQPALLSRVDLSVFPGVELQVSGDMTAFISSVPDEYGTYNRQIYTANLLTGETQSHGICHCHGVALSEDAKWIAFQEFRVFDDAPMIYRVTLINVVSSERQMIYETLTDHTPMATNGSLNWLDNSTTLIFNDPVRDTHGISPVWTYDATTDQLNLQKEWRQAGNPYFSPDGTMALEYDDPSVFIFDDPDNPDEIPVSDWERRIPPQSEGLIYAQQAFGAWLPDSSGFVMIDTLVSSETGLNQQLDLTHYDLTTRTRTGLLSITANGLIIDVSFNADGSKLLYRFAESDTYETSTVIYDMQTGLSESIQVNGYYPVWSER